MGRPLSCMQNNDSYKAYSYKVNYKVVCEWVYHNYHSSISVPIQFFINKDRLKSLLF